MKSHRHWTKTLSESLADMVGAGALAAGLGVSAMLLGCGLLATGAAAVAGFVVGWLVMRLVPATIAAAALPEFAATQYDAEAVYEDDEELLLEQRVADERAVDEIDEPEFESPVTQLFAPPPSALSEQVHTPGQMRARIAEHLATAQPVAPASDGGARDPDSLAAAWVAKRRVSQASVAGPAPVLPGNPAPLSASRIAAFLSGEQEAVPAPMVTLRETVPTIGPDGPVPASNPGDASDQLHAALDELRRSLRRG